MKYDCLVIGAGLSGCTAARLLAESGKKVLVLEKGRDIAGNCHDYLSEAGVTVHTHGPHIFHTIYKEVWDFLSRFTQFRLFQHRVLSYVHGMTVPFPINRDTLNAVFGESITTQDVQEFLHQEVKNSDFNTPAENFQDAVVCQVGQRLYELFFKNYTIKQWGRDPKELSAAVAARIPVRSNRDNRYFADKYQGIPIGGYTKMAQAMLDHLDITLMTGCDYFQIKENLSSLFDAENGITVYTGALDQFFEYKFGNLEYRSLDIKLKTVDKEFYQEAPVVNYPNDYDFTRITEFKHMTGEKSDKTVICMEYPKQEGHPYYVVMTKENMEKRTKYMEEVEKLEKTGRFIFTGRLAEYKYYNMDQAVKSAMDKIRGIL